jgi:hypothetical protein
MNIFINDEIVNFSKEDFPVLINGADKRGASFFSIVLLANLFKNGHKILLFSAYPPAKEEFRKQLGDLINGNALIVELGDEDNFISEIDNIIDLPERIILFKNIENYSTKLFDKLKNQKLIIFSGDVDKCEFGEHLAGKSFNTKIFFSYSDKIKIENKVDLPKYSGYIESSKYNGLIKLGD